MLAVVVECGPSDEGGGKGCTLLFNNWFRCFLVRHSQFGWAHPTAVCSVCVYKSRRAPRDLAHEPTPKKAGELEETFVCVTSVRSVQECPPMHAA